MIRRIEIDFALPVELTDDEMRKLADLVRAVCKRHEPEHHFFWQSGIGDKPSFSQADAAFLGKRPDPDAPETGEPTWDDSVLHLDTSLRKQYRYLCGVCGAKIWEREWRTHPHKDACRMIQEGY